MYEKVNAGHPDKMADRLQAEDFAAHRQHILTDRVMYERAREWYK